jgi:hypothetical protein
MANSRIDSYLEALVEELIALHTSISTRKHVLVAHLFALAHLAAPALTGRPISLERGEPASASRDTSTHSRPPS